MSIGSLAAMSVTLFGAISGAALAGVAAGLIPAASQLELWVVFTICFAGGVLLAFWLAPQPAVLLKAQGAFALVLALICGALALAATLGIAPAAAASRATLWTLFGLCLPVGLGLIYSGGALAPRGRSA